MPLCKDGTAFYKEIRVSDPECEIHNRMKLSEILRHMQEISGEHLDALGMPYEKLYETRQVFLLSKIWLTIVRQPKSGEILRWNTMPLPPIGAQFIRSNDVTDAMGNLILHSDSLWILVDPETRRILRPSQFQCNLHFGKPYGKENMERFHIKRPPSLQPAGVRDVLFSDLDVNRHMNNAIYANIVCDFLPDDVIQRREPASLYLHFQNEAVLHDRLEISHLQIAEDSWFTAADKADTKCFESILNFKTT